MTHVNTPQNSCLLGIARRDVTPPVGIYHRMWGAAAHDRSVGVHRPLTATALVLKPRSGNEQQVIIAVDHCLLFENDMRMLIERACSATGIARHELIVAFSHTHAAGLMDTNRVDAPGGDLIAPYLEQLAAEIAAAIRQAGRTISPVDIVYATGRCSLAAQRDFWDETNAMFVCGLNPAEPADDTVLVARVTDESHETIATIVNYACHPTTLAWDNQLISPDYVGAMREVVESATGAPCVFLQGASGDLVRGMDSWVMFTWRIGTAANWDMP